MQGVVGHIAFTGIAGEKQPSQEGPFFVAGALVVDGEHAHQTTEHSAAGGIERTAYEFFQYRAKIRFGAEKLGGRHQLGSRILAVASLGCDLLLFGQAIDGPA